MGRGGLRNTAQRARSRYRPGGVAQAASRVYQIMGTVPNRNVCDYKASPVKLPCAKKDADLSFNSINGMNRFLLHTLQF